MKIIKSISKFVLLVALFAVIQISIASLIHYISHGYILARATDLKDDFYQYLVITQAFLGGILAPFFSIVTFSFITRFIVSMKSYFKTRFYQRAIIIFIICFTIIMISFTFPHLKNVLNPFSLGDSQYLFTIYTIPTDFFGLLGYTPVFGLIIGPIYGIINLLIFFLIEGILRSNHKPRGTKDSKKH
ncbi:MAG: hypothetical protein ABI721_00425 [Candidatus Dojkabacteria bacterium]